MGLELLSFVMPDPLNEFESVFGGMSLEEGQGHVSLSVDG